MRFRIYQHIQIIIAVGILLAGIFFSYGLAGAQEVWICDTAPYLGEYPDQFTCDLACGLSQNGGGFCFSQEAIGTPVPPETFPPSTSGDQSPITQPLLNLKNPLGSINSFAAFAEAIFRAIVIIAIPLTVIFLIWGGILFVTSHGNEERVKTAKKVFLWTVIGAMVIVASWVIAVALNNSIQTL